MLITHEHGDHYLGLDELLCFRRNLPPKDWTPIPVYATEQAWSQVETRFGYLLGSLLEKRLAIPGRNLRGSLLAPGFPAGRSRPTTAPSPRVRWAM